jgi:structural maintenance of chromosome 2
MLQVDAALDLSHTQNIGRMIKEEFPDAQFIVVSLKEGMFNNANVIFRTRFVDGSSTVTRTSNVGSGGSGRGAQAAASKRGRLAAQQENAPAALV